MKNNVLHTKGILNSYSQQFIDHDLFKQTLLNNDKPNYNFFQYNFSKKSKNFN